MLIAVIAAVALASLIATFAALGLPGRASAQSGLTPPRILESPPAEYPASELEHGVDRSVVLHVTIDANGQLTEAHVDHSEGPAFDLAALAAVRRYRFSAAMRDGVAIPSTVRVEIPFVIPQFEVADAGPAEFGLDATLTADAAPPDAAPAPPSDAAPASDDAPSDAGVPDAGPPTEATDERGFSAEARVDPRAIEAPRGASDFEIDRDVLAAAPHREAADLLRAAPGVYVARNEGDAVAQSVTLRGFDAEHGQDIELRAGGVPINQPSHLHGQGYADLAFVLPEVVRGVRVTEGVYDAEQGDFAVAGTVDFDLGVTTRGVASRTTYGSFNTFRQLFLFAPEGEHDDSFGAVAYRSTDGFGENRDAQSGTAIAQYAFGEGRSLTIATAAFHAARAGLAGLVRRDDIDAGRIDFYGVYGEPTTLAQSASSARGQLSIRHFIQGDRRASTELGAYLLASDFRLQSNYTGYLQRSRTMPEWTGRGDLIEQRNAAFTLGARAKHRTRRYRLAPIDAAVEVGLSARLDLVEQAQNLLQAPQNETWDEQVDASIQGLDVGGFAELELRLFPWAKLRAGVRADLLSYSVDDRLGNFIPRFRRESYIVGFRRSALGVAAGPRVSLEVTPIEGLAFLAAYGEGYRSPQARLLEDGESAPYTKVRSADVGARWALGDRLTLNASAYLTALSDDVAFDPGEGRLERIGPTTRLGGTLYAVGHPLSFLVAALSVTYVHATLDEPPIASAEDPSPAFREGQLLPYVPPWVVRLDTGVNGTLVDIDEHPLTGKLGLGYSYLSRRPLPFGEFADIVSLVDVSGSLAYRNVDVGLSIYNLFDSEYAASELAFVSSFDPTVIPSRLPARHIAAGPPLTVLATLGLTL